MKFIIFLLVLASKIQNPGADATDSELDDILDENVEEMTVDNYRGQAVASEKDTETNIEVFNEETIEKELTNADTGSNKISTWKIVVIVCFFCCVCIPLYWVLSVWAFLWQSSASFCVFWESTGKAASY